MQKLFSTKKRITLILTLMFFGLTVLVAFVHEDGVFSVFRMDRELISMRISNENLRRELNQLQIKVKKLKTDPSSIEKIAREKLDMVKPGERVYRIVRQPASSIP